MARPSKSRIRLPAMGSRYLRSLLRAFPGFPFFPVRFLPPLSACSDNLRRQSLTTHVKVF